MTRLALAVASFLRRNDGQDLLEYVVLVALIALVAVGAVTAVGGKAEAVFNCAATVASGTGGSKVKKGCP